MINGFSERPQIKPLLKVLGRPFKGKEENRKGRVFGMWAVTRDRL